MRLNLKFNLIFLQNRKASLTIFYFAEKSIFVRFVRSASGNYILIHKNNKNDLFTGSTTHVRCQKSPNHGPAPIPEEGKWVKAKEIKDISGLTHGIGWCAPQQGAWQTDSEH